MLLHLGFAGYREVALQDLKNARTLSRALENSGYYEVLSDIHRPDSSSVVEDIKSTFKANQEDVEVCIFIQEVSPRPDHFKELHARASRGFLQIFGGLPHQVSGSPAEVDPDAPTRQGLDCAQLRTRP